MAANRSKSTKRESAAPSLRRDWRHVLPVAGLLTAVVGALLIGAVLQVDGDVPLPAIDTPATGPPVAAAEPVPTAAIRPTPAETAPLPTTTEVPAAAESGDEILDLARRARRDEQRLARSGGAWTLQFMMACDPANVAPPAKSLAAERDFYLLSKMHDQRACFRLCWGSFASRDLALAANGIPAPLARLAERPQPLPVEQVLQ